MKLFQIYFLEKKSNLFKKVVFKNSKPLLKLFFFIPNRLSRSSFIILISFIILTLSHLIPTETNFPLLLSSHIKAFPLQNISEPSDPKFLQPLSLPATQVKPLNILQAPSPWTTKGLTDIAESLDHNYINDPKIQHINERAKRVFLMFMQYETISRLRYNRGSGRLLFQKDLQGLSSFIMQSRWYREALKRLSSSDIYGFSENHLIRILMAIQAGAHFFEVPYPALFCLFFQESKLDFKAVSATGAKGVGQLTSIGLKQAQKLRKRSLDERKLQGAIKHLQQVYHDPIMLKWLKNINIDANLPTLGLIPKRIEFTKISSTFIKQVANELVKRGYKYGNNIGLVWVLCKKIRRGYILPDRYAPVHGVYSEMMEKHYALSQASIYQIETNILLSTMLFNHYYRYRYRWRNNLQKFELQLDTRMMLATAAYNHGQTGMRRYLINLKHEFPMLDLKELSARKLQLLFTTRRLSRALRRPFRKVREASRHVRYVMECAEQRSLLQNNTQNYSIISG